MRRPQWLQKWLTMMNPPVFFGAAGTVILFILYGALFTNQAGAVFSTVLSAITTNLGWYYVGVMTFFLFFVVWLLLSPYATIRLGGEDTRPEFSRPAWFAMLFAAGMGMGLVFWGVAEPITHYLKPPMAEPETAAALRESMRFTFFHWGFHPWAVYIIFALGIAYFHFGRGLPLAPRSLLYPILGERYRGWIGHLADIICTVGTLLGVATSLGLGAMQINSGVTALTDVSFSTGTQVAIIVIITVVATASTVSGVSKGIRLLSTFNMVVAMALLAFVLLAGPTLYQLEVFSTSLGNYLQRLVATSLWVDLRPGSTWQATWTIFYWGWWISWCPFVGIFVARISKGRTIREFIIVAFLVPVMVTFLWLSVFGGTALHIELYGGGGIAAAVKDNVATSLNALLAQLPWSNITQVVGLVLIVTFFITSSDSGSLVDDMVTSGGHPNPPAAQRVFWGVSEGATAAVLLVAGGLTALQSAAIASGLPMSLLVLVTCYTLVKALRQDVAKRKRAAGEAGRDPKEAAEPP